MPPAPEDQDFQYTIDVQGRLADPSEFANIIVKTQRQWRPTIRGCGRRPGRARRADLFADLQARTASPPPASRSTSRPRPTRWRSATRSTAKMAELAQRFRQGLRYDVPFDTTLFVQRLDQRGLQDAVRGRRPGADRDPVFLQDWRAMLVPATTVPVTHHRRLRRHGGARLHHQPVDPVRHRAGDRHRGRRCDRHRRRRRAPHRSGHDAATTPRSGRWTSCSGRSSASPWC